MRQRWAERKPASGAPPCERGRARKRTTVVVTIAIEA
jgi:hypothetical protein